MTNINKSFKCAGCSTDFPVSITTDLEISECTLLAKCPKCGAAMQIHLMVAPQQPATPLQPQPPLPSLDDSIFVPPEMPSDDIKNLIEG